MSFTRDELIAAIEAATPAPEETPNSITTRELAQASNVTIPAAREWIRAALREKLLRAERVARVDMAGRLQKVPGYVLAQNE